MTVFLGTVLSKRYTNPSADIISILAGLDHVDAVFLDFADALEGILIAGRSCKRQILFYQCLLMIAVVELREKAVEVTVSLTSGAYQTSLVSYFTHRDLFPALIKVGDCPPYSMASTIVPLSIGEPHPGKHYRDLMPCPHLFMALAASSPLELVAKCL